MTIKKSIIRRLAKDNHPGYASIVLNSETIQKGSSNRKRRIGY